MKTLSRVVVALAAVAALAGTALATAPSAAADTVTLTVTVIHATEGAPEIDPALERYKQDFARSFAKFKRFKSLGEQRLQIARGSEGTATVAGDKRLAVRYVDLDASRGFLRMEVSFDGARMTMQVKDGGLWFHAGRRHGGGILILALRATTRG